MSFVDRFRERANLPITVEVPVLAGEDSFVLIVSRFAQEEMNKVGADAEKECRARGLEPKKADQTQYLLTRAYALGKQIEQHVKGWKHKPAGGKEPIEYSDSNRRELFKAMNENELVSVGMSYMVALYAATEDAKKAKRGTNSETSSATHSENGSKSGLPKANEAVADATTT